MWWIICIFLFLPGSVISRPRCGGVYTAARGIIQSPNFPNKFPVPIHCEWIIDAQHVGSINSSIIVYMSQLFVFEGLTFKEYQIYDQTYQLNGRDIHTVTENNVTKVSFVESKQDYLVITLKLGSIESTHLRVLDHLLDIYGFNITYEISTGPPRPDRCTMMDCGFTGTCYDHYNRFSCSCFPGYEGYKCSEGPNSLCTPKICKNGGTCMHMGDTAIRCECKPGFTGEHCESHITAPTMDCEKCSVTCPFNGKDENICKCPEGSNSTFSDNLMDYLATIKIINVPYQNVNQQKMYIENQISRSIRDIIPTLDDCHISRFESFSSHVEVTFHMSGSKKDERRLKSVMSKWSDRGHVGNLSLAPQQAIALASQPPASQQSISIQPSGLIHAGEDFVLSCTTQGSSPSFRWFKDGLFVNVTAPTSSKWEKLIEEPENRDQYTALLGIKNASPFDQGTFTCQIIENGIQKCLRKRVDIRAAPRVWIEPMSLTVRKGENFTIKCFSASNNNNGSKYTYSWTKNRELLPIKTDTEHYEVLFPIGSILQVSSINKSTSFSCLVQDSAVWSEQSILVNVIDTELVKTCRGERHLKLLWPETAPGTESLQECPLGYFGVARRACTLRDTGQPTWYLPDFSECIVGELLDLVYEFQKLRLGYVSRSPAFILRDYRNYLREGKVSLLPGEGSRILRSVRDVISYMNNSIDDEIGNIVLDVVNYMLQQKYSVINQTQVVLLQQVLKRQSLKFQSTFHRALSAIDVTLTLPDKTEFHVPLPSQSYPSWFSYKLHLALPQHYFAAPNKSAALALVVYRNLSAFLPQRSAIRLKDGIEMDYEVISNVASTSLVVGGVDVSGNLSDAVFTMEFKHPSKNATFDLWKILCGIADYASYGYSWDTQTCVTRLLEGTKTRCLCPRAGTYAVLLTMKPSFAETETIPVKQIVILTGCLTCALLTIVAGLILSFYWYYRRSCLVFLKIQCCLSTFGSMVVLVYALWDDVRNEMFLVVMSLLEIFLLTGMSSQLSNLLIIYSELVQLPRMKNIKQTVVLIITGAPMIAVFGNHMAHLTINTRINSWWLLEGSLSFKIFIGCSSIIVILYFVLFYIVTNKIRRLNVKFEKSSEPLKLRLKLLNRSVLVFCSITVLITSSILYINYTDNMLYHYLFSGVSVLVGSVIFFCYIVYSETSIRQLLISKLMDKHIDKLSPDASKQLKFSVFTKEKGEVENDSTPYFFKNGAETHFMYDPVCKQKLSEIGSTTFKTYASAEFIENHDIIAHSSQSSDLQLYEKSPKQFQREIVNSPDLLGSKKFVELDLVASSMKQPTNSFNFYEKNTTEPTVNFTKTPTTPVITITKAESADRPRPDGEEKIKSETEIVPIISIKEASPAETQNINDENLDAVMDSITHDLDYLLNGNEFENESNTPAVNMSSLRRISRPPSISVFEQIAEEPEEDVKIPEAITDVSRTNC